MLLLMQERHEQALERSAKAEKKRPRMRTGGVSKKKRIKPTRSSITAPDTLKKLN
jgi:hypothetical protein